MPLFLKNIAPELDIFGNRQIFNFNKDPAGGESDSALTLMNWFTPISNVNVNSTFEFLTPTMKGFRFNHSLSTTGTFGNFNFEKYDRFGLATPLWGYNEQTDSISFFKNVSLSGLSITGNLSLNSNKITNLANGIANTDAINLGQLNNSISALGFSSLVSNGLVARTAANTYASRNIAVGTGLGISNADGAAGNPTFSLSVQLQNLHNLNSLGFLSLSTTGTGSSSFVNRTLTVDSNLTISNSNGVSGNPLLGLSSDIIVNSLTASGGSVSATTGTLKGNNLAVHNSSSISVLNSVSMNNNYITSLAYPINTQDAATKQYVDNSSGGSTKSILHGYLYSTYNSNLSSGDHIKFDNTAFIRGSNINLDSSSSYNTSTNTSSIGRITLASGKTYKLTAITCTANFTSTSGGYLGLKWYNSDSNTPLGTVNTWWSSSWSYTSGGAVVAFITPSSTTRVELRINNIASISQIYGTSDSNSATWFVVEEV